MKALIINGPNLNLIGKRKTDVYGTVSLDDYLDTLKKKYDFEVYQSNVEGELINKLQEADNNYDGILINAGGYTHTSVAITDAIEAISTPVIEVHISNIFDRESFRNKSLISKNCAGHISGFGLKSYEIGLKHLLEM
ncbi:MAG: type II 3-dehydroquinate dehydratase [Flavobacteriales bacterium]|jgi:3-dehydroquinate dehydratase-2|tara:strand:+ start:21550 stop:21960 length:411 start_codon:yes stop_codon:yes gene_type:complete